MQLGIFAKTFPGSDPESVLTASASAGYTGVAYNLVCSGLPSMPDVIPAGVASDVRHVASATGQRIFSVSATYNMAHPDPLVRKHGLDRLRVIAASARDMGTELLTLCTGTRDPDDKWKRHPDNDTAEAWRDMISSLEKAVQIAEAHDVYLGVEPELANVVSTADKAERLIAVLRTDRVRIVLDPANLFEPSQADTQRAVIARATETLAEHLVMAHVKDRHGDGTPTAAGQGEIDVEFFLSCLTEVGFDGPLVTHGLEAEDARPVAQYLSGRLQRQPERRTAWKAGGN